MSAIFPAWSRLFFPQKPFGKAPGDQPPILALRQGPRAVVAASENFLYPPPPLAPSALGATAWYRADLEATPALWEDQIDDDPNKDLVQAVGANQPTITASNAAFGGQSTVDFDPTVANEFLASIAWAVPVVQPFGVFLVGSADNTNTTRFFSDGIGAVNRAELFKAATYREAATTVLDSTVVRSAAPRIFFAYYAGTQSRIFVSSLRPFALGNAGVKGIDGLTVGADEAGANGLLGSIAEVAVFRAVGPAGLPRLVSSLMQYASARYRLPVVT